VSDANKIRCAIYVRCSTSDKQNPEMQRLDLEAYARARGFEVYRVYEDVGFSGSASNRPMLKVLLQDVREAKVTYVLCWRLDRWFRSLKEVVVTLSELTERGVTFISLKDGIDLSNSTGRLMANLLACFAQFELEVIRERVRAGLDNARRKGRVGGRRPMIDVATVTALRQQGLSLSEIAGKVGATKSGVSKTLKKSSLATRHKSMS
jgi:putative DNA-invertase from lambdoid prophage Rac